MLKVLAILTRVRKFTSTGTILSFGCPAAREAHPAERRENCWPASWRGSNYSNDRGRLRFSSSRSSSSSSAWKRFNCRNRFRYLRRDDARIPFLICDTIFHNSHQTFLLPQSCCRFNQLINYDERRRKDIFSIYNQIGCFVYRKRGRMFSCFF